MRGQKQKGSRIVAAKEYYPYLKGMFCANADEDRAEWEREKDGTV